MTAPTSKSSHNRVAGKYQVDEQRETILDAAEKLFLEAGIEPVRMIDIAQRAGITRVTLYRYFANRDEVAVAVHLRLMRKSAQLAQFDPDDFSLEGHKNRIQAMIRGFPLLRDRYRYSGMFDKIYLDNPPESSLTRWTFNQLLTEGFVPFSAREGQPAQPFAEELAVVMNTVVWFLEKLALRGELTWASKEAPMEEHLRVFEDMIIAYLDRMIASRDAAQPNGSTHPSPTDRKD